MVNYFSRCSSHGVSQQYDLSTDHITMSGCLIRLNHRHFTQSFVKYLRFTFNCLLYLLALSLAHFVVSCILKVIFHIGCLLALYVFGRCWFMPVTSYFSVRLGPVFEPPGHDKKCWPIVIGMKWSISTNCVMMAEVRSFVLKLAWLWQSATWSCPQGG